MIHDVLYPNDATIAHLPAVSGKRMLASASSSLLLKLGLRHFRSEIFYLEARTSTLVRVNYVHDRPRSIMLIESRPILSAMAGLNVWKCKGEWRNDHD